MSLLTTLPSTVDEHKAVVDRPAAALAVAVAVVTLLCVGTSLAVTSPVPLMIAALVIVAGITVSLARPGTL